MAGSYSCIWKGGGVESQGLRLGVGRGILRGGGVSKDLHWPATCFGRG